MRRALVAAVALMLMVPALGFAAAQSHQRTGDRPSARIQAEGSGLMTVTGRLTANGLIPGDGIVNIRDRRGDARAHLDGEPLELRRGERTRVRRASGILYVTGSAVTVTVIGDDLSFSIAGNGRALFAGSGVFRLDSGPEAEWSGEWVRIAPSSSAERRRARLCADCSSSAARAR